MTPDEIKTELDRRLESEPRLDHRVNAVIEGGRYLKHVPPAQCADGFRMSVQASEGHYCSPRDSIGPWRAVEIGYPSAKVDAFMPYIDGADSDPTDTVYGYVPIDVVVAAIADHGGFAA